MSFLGRLGAPTQIGVRADLVEAFRSWASEAIVRDARARRNLAIHAHYEKSPNPLIRTWLLEAVQVDGEASPYTGPLDVHAYCELYLEKLGTSSACPLRISPTASGDEFRREADPGD